MNKALSVQRKLIKKAQRKLGRCLTRHERVALEHLDDRVALNVTEMEDGDMVEFLHSMAEERPTVEFLGSLGEPSGTIAEARQRMVDYLAPRSRRVMRTVDWESVYEEFRRWFLAVLRRDPPPKSSRALRFGVAESGGGFIIYVCAADRYTPSAQDWSEPNEWFPKSREVRIEQLEPLWSSLRRCGARTWIVIQAVIMILIREFFEKERDVFQRATGLRQVYVVTGFDDGEQYSVRTELTPAKRQR